MMISYSLLYNRWFAADGNRVLAFYKSRGLALRHHRLADLGTDEHCCTRAEREATDAAHAAVVQFSDYSTAFIPARLDKRGFWRFRATGKLVPEGSLVTKFLEIR